MEEKREGWKRRGKIGRVEEGRLEEWKSGRSFFEWQLHSLMLTRYILLVLPQTKRLMGIVRSLEELSGANPTLTVALGTAQKVDCVWFGVENVLKATISLDGTAIVAADAYPEKKGFASFTERAVTNISLAVTEKEDASLPVKVSEIIAGKVLLELPDQVFLPNTRPAPALRGAGIHEMLGGGLRPWSVVNNAKAKLDINYTGSRWKPDRIEKFIRVYENNRTFYFVRDTLSHPLDGYLAVFDNVTLPVPYSTGFRPAGQNVQFTVRES